MNYVAGLDDFDWRQMFYRQLSEWVKEGKTMPECYYSLNELGRGRHLLCLLVGKPYAENSFPCQVPEEIEVVKGLIGPHGWSYFKALLVKRGLT